MESRFEQPIELVAQQNHGWLLIFIALTLIWGLLRLIVNQPLIPFLLPGVFPTEDHSDDNSRLYQLGILQIILTFLLIIPVAYFCTNEIPTPIWIESAANLIPEFLCWLLLWILVIGTWYVTYYVVFTTLEEPNKGKVFITSNSVIWGVLTVVGVPLLLIHQYQPEILNDPAINNLLSGLLVTLVVWKVIVHSLLIWFRLNLPVVYRFLYLCTLEILPVAVLAKLVLTGL